MYSSLNLKHWKTLNKVAFLLRSIRQKYCSFLYGNFSFFPLWWGDCAKLTPCSLSANWASCFVSSDELSEYSCPLCGTGVTAYCQWMASRCLHWLDLHYVITVSRWVQHWTNTHTDKVRQRERERERVKRGFQSTQRTQRNECNSRKKRKLQPIGTELSAFQQNSSF